MISVEPYLAALALLALSTAIGIVPVVKLIRVYEAQHELKRGSAGFLRALSGWAIIVFWIMATWFVATILGDWAINGDLDTAIDRSMLRLYVLLELAFALADSD